MIMLRRSTCFERALPTLTRRTLLVVVLLLPVASALGADGEAKSRWFKGTTHSHSFWSDGDAFPEMVVDYFKSHGYDFFSLTDHNVLMQGDRWVNLAAPRRRPISTKVVDECRKRFGEDWVQLRGEGAKREIRLKTFEEIKARMEEPGKFLLIQGEEISDGTNEKRRRAVHINALNVAERIKPRSGATVLDLIRRDLSPARRQAERLKCPILCHVNHPNFAGYPVSARDLAEVAELRFVEICNNHNGVCHNGDANHPGVERLWDVANTLRLAEKKVAPLYGVASDDSHNYHTTDGRAAIPGRGWIVVRATELTADALLAAMGRGDFYASTGVKLAAADYDANERTLRVEVVPKPGVQYTIEFIGTPAGIDLKRPGVKRLDTLPKIGKVLASYAGTSATYRLTGEELYVRALVRSDRKMAHPNTTGTQNETAWTQPVGWDLGT